MLPLGSGARGIRFEDRGSRNIVLAVDRARFIAVQVGAVAGERDQVSHGS